ncbi:MAG: PepSY domain-containing protein [Hyphomonadaceae bacterium]
MTARTILLAAAAFAALALPALPAAAQSVRADHPWIEAQYGGRRGDDGLSVREIIQAVRAQLGPGDVIGAPVRRGGVYFVRWRRADGVVMDVTVDAQSGRIVG